MDVPSASEATIGPYRLLELLAKHGGFAAQFFQFGSFFAGHGL
jgi:hypothetical protein